MKKILATIATTLAFILSATSLSYAAPPAADADWEVSSTQPPAASTPQLSPFLPFGTIALCNAGWGNVSVQRFNNARFLGAIDLRCGDSQNGYVHIRRYHQSQWQDRINHVGTSGNWDDLMTWVTNQAVTYPEAGFPKYVGGNKYCYTTPVYMYGPRGSIQFRPTIIVSTNHKRIITSYPTGARPNC